MHVCSLDEEQSEFAAIENGCVNCERKIDGRNERHDTHCNVYYYCLTEGKFMNTIEIVFLKKRKYNLQYGIIIYTHTTSNVFANVFHWTECLENAKKVE